MKRFSSEYVKSYETYTFGYTNYCIKEMGDSWSEIYEQGFLPYTGDYTLEYSIFYMARSLRIDLEQFKESSENRRVARKFEDREITIRLVSKSDFVFDDHFFHYCEQYANARFRNGEMKKDRLEYLISREELTHIMVFEMSGSPQPIAYVLCCIDDEMMHYWFSFFDLELLEEGPIGKLVMFRAIEWAQDHDKKYVYLGTCYGNKSLYKVRDFKAVEFFQGYGWNNDVNLIKELCKSDDQPTTVDLFKSMHIPNIDL